MNEQFRTLPDEPSVSQKLKAWHAPELQEAPLASTAAKSPDFTEATFEKTGS